MRTEGVLERESALAQLRDAVGAVAAGGAGRLVLVTGEAGAGKTTLVRTLLESLGDDVTVRRGACDNLRTPRPLAPVVELLAAPELLTTPREALFREITARLSGSSATVAVLEDAHWADEATLDVLAYVGRRIADLPTVLVVTYRADELGTGHPLRTTLGDLAAVRPLRVDVPALSVQAVARLCEPSGFDPAELHARTGGNAFFVTETLAAGGATLPDTVREAVLARVAGLDDASREVLEVAAVVPGAVELWLLQRAGGALEAVDRCVASGVLAADGDRLRFRHELARLAVLDSLLPVRRRRLHAAVATALAAPPDGEVDHTRRAHHAAEADDVDGVLESAPLAAQASAAVGARREAAAHLEHLLAHAARLPPAQRVDHWRDLAQLRAALGRHSESVAAYTRAAETAGELGDDVRRGELLARMLTPLSMTGDLRRAHAAVDEALAVLERGDPTPALALAWAQRCSLHMLARELRQAEPWGRRAVDLAARLGDREILAYALIQSGVALWMSGDEAGYARLLDGVGVAREIGDPALVAQGLSQIGSGGGEVRRYREALAALHECVDYADRLELSSRGLYAAAWLARCDLDQGRWADAGDRIEAVLRSPRCEGVTRMTALTDLGRLRARRGDPQAWEPLDETLALARPTGHLQRLWPIAVARAEAAWLDGDLSRAVPLLQEVYAAAAVLDQPWATGQLALWLTRAEVAPTAVPAVARPYSLQLSGRHGEAAAAWDELGCPYDAADALGDSDEEEHLRSAYVRLQALGARPAARRVADRMRDLGQRVPRGPQTATRANPVGLTDRELEVLRLVAAGRSNAEIAAELHLSVKTVGHHVSRVLGKLGAPSRAAAAATAHRLGVGATP